MEVHKLHKCDHYKHIYYTPLHLVQKYIRKSLAPSQYPTLRYTQRRAPRFNGKHLSSNGRTVAVCTMTFTNAASVVFG